MRRSCVSASRAETIRMISSPSDQPLIHDPSQGRRFAQNSVAYLPVQRLVSSHMNLDAEQVLKILHQSGVVEQAAAGSHATSRSRSLFSLASPRATEPNTRSLSAP